MWEIELIPMFLLIGIWGGQRREYAAWKFLIYTLVGSAFTLVGIFLIYFQTGGANASFQHFAQTAPSLAGSLPLLARTVSLALVIFLLLFTGFAVRFRCGRCTPGCLTPTPRRPPRAAVMLAGVLLKMGAYGLIRICLGFAPAWCDGVRALGIIAAINVLWGAGASMVQKDMKKMIAYSSVSHMGYVLLGLLSLELVGIQGAVIQMVSHGLVAAGLFLMVGMIYERCHTRELAAYGGLAKLLPVYSVFFMILTLDLVGLPTTSGFTGEFLVLLGAFKAAWPPFVLGQDNLPLVLAVVGTSPASCSARCTCCALRSLPVWCDQGTALT